MDDDLRNRVARAIDATIQTGDGFNIENLPEVADAALAEMGVLQNQLDEAINQLDSARHSVDVLERRIAELLQK